MKINNLKLVLISLAIGALSFTIIKKPITVYIVGDSTAANKLVKAYPETGWGMPFAHFFDTTVVVQNLAKNGRSTRTFLSEGLWKTAYDNLKEGDYVFIQFGHNDESKEKVDRYTTPEEYKANLTRFVKETRSKNGIPVLLTPVSRRYFDKEGNITETHPIYTDLVKEVAKELQVPCIDMNEKTKALYQQMGSENSKLLFLQLAPGEHPNYPEGKQDNTHFNELGARKVAQLLLTEIRNLKLELANRIVVPKTTVK